MQYVFASFGRENEKGGNMTDQAPFGAPFAASLLNFSLFIINYSFITPPPPPIGILE
jgi:hypothetical protein